MLFGLIAEERAEIFLGLRGPSRQLFRQRRALEIGRQLGRTVELVATDRRRDGATRL